MNVIQPIAAPGKPAAATQGLVDVDIHPRADNIEAFKPFLSERWWEHLQTWGMRARHGFTAGQPPFPKAQPLACRRDAWPPTGGTPASDLDFLRFQHGLAAPRRRDAMEAVPAEIGRHDRVRIEPMSVGHTQPQLALGPARSRTGQRRREIALEPNLRDRGGVAQDAEAPRPVCHDHPPAGTVAGRAGERAWDGVSDHPLRRCETAP